MLWHKVAGAGGTGGLNSITHTANTPSAVQTNATETFSSVNLGSNTTNKKVIVVYAWVNGTARTLSSCTIDGVSATVGMIHTGFAQVGYGYAYADVTSTSGDIVLTLSGSTLSGYDKTINVWEWHEDNSFSIVANDVGNDTSNGDPDVNVTAGDAVFAVAFSTSTNITGYTDSLVTLDFGGGGSDEAAGHVERDLTVTETPSDIMYLDLSSGGANAGAVSFTPTF